MVYKNNKNISVMVDFNLESTKTAINTFIDQHELYNLIKEKTCLKTESGSYVDLILTNQQFSFKGLLK